MHNIYSYILYWDFELIGYDNESVCLRSSMYDRLWIKMENKTIHKKNGPAMVYNDGVALWYINGKEQSERYDFYEIQKTNRW